MASWKPPSREKQSSALGTALQMNAATRVAEAPKAVTAARLLLRISQ